MNCSELADILDREPDARSPESRHDALMVHLGCCEDCAAAVAAHRILQADRVPDQPGDLLASVMAAVPRRTDDVRRRPQPSRRRVAAAAGGLLVGGAVFAALILSVMEGDESPLADSSEVVAPETDVDAAAEATTTNGSFEMLIEYVEAADAAEQQALTESLMSLPDLPDGEYFALLKVAPIYPAEAASRGLEGYAIVEFTISETGDVIEPVIVEASHEPFAESSIETVLQFKYKPRVVDGVPVAVEGVRNRIVYVLESQAEGRPGGDTEDDDAESALATAADSELDFLRFRALMQPAYDCLQKGDLRCIELNLDEILATYRLSAQQAAQIRRIYGFVEYSRGNYERAIESYLSSARLAEDPATHFSRSALMIAARIHHDRGQYQEALDIAIEYLKLTPNPMVADYVFVDRLRQLGATVR